MKDYCCTDCLMLIANGELPSDWNREKIDRWLVDIDERTAGFYVVPGDDEINFSSIGCDVCGSQLGGYRHEVVFFEHK